MREDGPTGAWEAILRQFGDARVLVDSSKELPWIEACLRLEPRPDVRVLHITKRVEGYAASCLGRSGTRLPRPIFLQVMARSWARRNQQIAAFASEHDLGYLHVAYEDLATDPDVTLAGIDAFLGIDVEPTQLDPTLVEQHYAKGNPGVADKVRSDARTATPEADRSGQIALDERWRRVLTSREVGRMRASRTIADALAAFEYDTGPGGSRRPGDVAIDAVATAADRILSR